MRGSSPLSVPIPAPGGTARIRRGRRGLLALTALAAPILLQGCADPPIADLVRTRAAVDRARQSGADRYAPSELRQAVDAVQAAQREITLQTARFPFRRNYRPATSMLERARFYAIHARREMQERRDRVETEARDRVRGLQDSLARAAEIRRILAPRDSRINHDLVGAGVDLEMADRDLQGERYSEALRSAESGLTRVRRAEEALLASVVRYTKHPDTASWRRWVDEAVQRSRSGGDVAFVVDKLRRKMTVYRAGRQVKVYSVDIGLGGMERKLRAGDDATPEGLYKIQQIRGPGQTRYYRAFLLDYPNLQDRRRFELARRNGEIPKGADPGSLIEIHGEGGRDKDWTRGCVALTNPEMDELARMVKVGTPVAIVGYNPKDPEELL